MGRLFPTFLLTDVVAHNTLHAHVSLLRLKVVERTHILKEVDETRLIPKQNICGLIFYCIERISLSQLLSQVSYD